DDRREVVARPDDCPEGVIAHVRKDRTRRRIKAVPLRVRRCPSPEASTKNRVAWREYGAALRSLADPLVSELRGSRTLRGVLPRDLEGRWLRPAARTLAIEGFRRAALGDSRTAAACPRRRHGRRRDHVSKERRHSSTPPRENAG